MSTVITLELDAQAAEYLRQGLSRLPESPERQDILDALGEAAAGAEEAPETADE